MKKTILIILCLSISFSVYAKEQGCTNKEINPKVQLQDNGWLKIVDQYIEEFTPEEYYKGFGEQAIKTHKDMVKMGLEREKIRMLNVKIQFLKPCIATTSMEEYLKGTPSKDADVTDVMIPKFRCDYRFKVFHTTFSPSEFKKHTSQVFNDFPSAPVTDVTDDQITRKTEMLPGETMWMRLYIPHTATSWCVWVPK